VPSRLVFSFGGASRDWLASTSVFDLLDGAQRPPNLIRRILLYAMNPPHPNLALVQPRAVEVDLAPDQKSTGSAEIGSSGISLVDIHLPDASTMSQRSLGTPEVFIQTFLKPTVGRLPRRQS